MDPPILSAAGKRRRRWIWLGLAAGAIAAVAIALTLLLRWQEQRDWREACAEADRLDPGWRWGDLAAPRPALPDERNSAVHIAAASKMLPTQTTGGLKDKNLDREYREARPQRRPSSRVVSEVGQMLDAVRPALTEARRAADCPDGALALPESPVILQGDQNHIGFFIVTQGLLYPEIFLQSEAGDVDGALVTLRAILYASRPADGHGLFVPLTAGAQHRLATRGVERVLAQGEPSVAALEVIGRVLADEANRPLLLIASRGERAVVEDSIRAWNEGRLSRTKLAELQNFSDGGFWTGNATINAWLERMTGGDCRLSNATAQLRHCTWMIECLKESLDALQARAAEWAAHRRQLPPGPRRSAEMYARFVAAFYANEASFRCAVAAVAVERFRRANGRWPTTLGEVVPRYLAALPRDPFDSQPLKLASRPDGVVIYSVGQDGADDGGDLSDSLHTRKDLGLRLWNVAERRQRPAAEKGRE